MSAEEVPVPSKRLKWPWILVGTLIAAFIVLRVAMPSYKIPSGAMIPSLVPGDTLFALRSSAMPGRGDIVVFRFPENESQLFTKRVLGIPGDKLEFVSGRVVLNGKLVPNCHVGAYVHEGHGYELYLEALGEAIYGTLLSKKPSEWKSCSDSSECPSGEGCGGGLCGNIQGPFSVGPGELWMVGDNRDNSHDSRSWGLGRGTALPQQNLVAAARMIGFSSSPIEFEHSRGFAPANGPPILPRAIAPALGPAMQTCKSTLKSN